MLGSAKQHLKQLMFGCVGGLESCSQQWLGDETH